jgi:hypothetical protein
MIGIYRKLNKKKINKTLPAGTNKKVSFTISACSKLEHINKGYINNLGSYLAGLIEGDGSIIVPSTLRNEKGKLLYPKIKITFVGKDLPLAQKLIEVLGKGTLEWSKNNTYLNLLILPAGRYKNFIFYCFYY